MRSATTDGHLLAGQLLISIHALHAERDAAMSKYLNAWVISIHALHAERDSKNAIKDSSRFI